MVLLTTPQLSVEVLNVPLLAARLTVDPVRFNVISLAMATGFSSSNTVTVTEVTAPTLVPSEALKYTVRAPRLSQSKASDDAHVDWSWDNSMVVETLQLSEATADTSEAVMVTAPAASNTRLPALPVTVGPVKSWTVNVTDTPAPSLVPSLART